MLEKIDHFKQSFNFFLPLKTDKIERREYEEVKNVRIMNIYVSRRESH